MLPLFSEHQTKPPGSFVCNDGVLNLRSNSKKRLAIVCHHSVQFIDEESFQSVHLSYESSPDNECVADAAWFSNSADLVALFCSHACKLLDLRCKEISKPAVILEADDQLTSRLLCGDLSPDGMLVCAGFQHTQESAIQFSPGSRNPDQNRSDDDSSAFIRFWDIRKKDFLGCYCESHSDDITQVKFHPSSTSLLVSGSMDGLVNLYDIRETCEEEALQSTLNVSSSLARLGFFGENRTGLFCLTHDDSFQLWNLPSCEITTSYSLHLDAASLPAKRQRNQIHSADYFVDGAAVTDSTFLLVAANDSSNILLLFMDELGNVTGQQELTDNHKDVIRAAVLTATSERGYCLFTGGDEGIVKLWTGSTSNGRSRPFTKKKKRRKQFQS